MNSSKPRAEPVHLPLAQLQGLLVVAHFRRAVAEVIVRVLEHGIGTKSKEEQLAHARVSKVLGDKRANEGAELGHPCAPGVLPASRRRSARPTYFDDLHLLILVPVWAHQLVQEQSGLLILELRHAAACWWSGPATVTTAGVSQLPS